MLGAESWGSELGVDDAGVFLPLRSPLNVSASCVNGFFFGEVVLVEGLGVALLPSSVTSPSDGPESDSEDAGARQEEDAGGLSPVHRALALRQEGTEAAETPVAVLDDLVA